MELNTKLQHRVAFQPSGLVMREAGEEKRQVIEGVAIVTNAETVLYESQDWREVEVIDPSCITKEIIDNEDIKLNLLHERGMSFARCNKRAGSLVLDTREDGLHFEVEVPDCDLGKRAKALIGNGTYTGCSFEFYPADYEVSERQGADGKTEYVIRHTRFAQIGAITIGMDPAYEQTSVGLREAYEAMHSDDAAKREAELKAAAEAKAAAEEAERIAREKSTRERTLREIKSDLAADLAAIDAE